MSTSLLAVVVDCHDSTKVAQFWANALSWDVLERNPNEIRVSDPAGAGTPLYFMNVPEAKAVKNRLHIDISTDGPIETEVERLIAAGATLIEVRQDPDTLSNPDTWTVLADPEGNEFCLTTSALPGWE
jgi:predicted enzyme related to lactoylglutathione lyase